MSDIGEEKETVTITPVEIPAPVEVPVEEPVAA